MKWLLFYTYHLHISRSNHFIFFSCIFFGLHEFKSDRATVVSGYFCQKFLLYSQRYKIESKKQNFVIIFMMKIIQVVIFTQYTD
jgi:hypothetical protein